MDSRISELIDSLPTLTEDDVDINDYCPICFVDFKTILDEDDSKSVDAESTGITRLVACNHVFCRKDLIRWIRSWHGSCPTCRHIFLSNLYPDSESEDESDGEYEPDDHEEEEEEEEESSNEAEPEESEDAFGEDEEFEEEDDNAMGLFIDPDSEDYYNEESSIEAATARQEAYVEEQVQAVEDVVARIEAELQEEEGYGVEETSFEDALTEEEEGEEYANAEEFSDADSTAVLEEDTCEEAGDDLHTYEEVDQR